MNTNNITAQNIIDSVNDLVVENEALKAKIAEVAAYLSSDKFSVDRTVSVSDVLARLGVR
jgi:hypothetical protein